MRLHQRVLNTRSSGFTLIELLLAIAIGGTVSWVATDAVMTHLKTNENLDTAIRQREDWSRTSHFIESEVALSERVLTSFATASTTHCKNEITASEFRLFILVSSCIFLSTNFSELEQLLHLHLGAYVSSERLFGIS